MLTFFTVQLGIVLSGNEISQILLSLVLSYFGGQRNRPKWIAWGGIISGLSCFILALAHFFFGPGDHAIKLTKEYMYRNEVDSSLLSVSTVVFFNINKCYIILF